MQEIALRVSLLKERFFRRYFQNNANILSVEERFQLNPDLYGPLLVTQDGHYTWPSTWDNFGANQTLLGFSVTT